MTPKRDFRKLDPAQQAEVRRIGVDMVLSGKTRTEVAAAVGVNRRFVSKWIDAVQREGRSALAGKKRGRRPGEQKALTSDEERKIRRLIADKCPDQLKLPFALWTRETVAMLIERKTTKWLSRKAVGRYLKAWGFTPQRPRRRATERNQSAIHAWLNTDYPEIKARAKAEKAEIQWGDETGVSNQANYGRSFAPRGLTPVIERAATRFTQSMISSVTNTGKLRFMIYNGALNAAIFLRFLKRLVKDALRKIFLIVDNLRPHRAKVVMTWVKDNSDKIELFFLPPYAPEYNPDEFLHNDIKQAVARGTIPKTKDALGDGLRSYMRGLQRRPAKIRAFFQAPSVRYAA